MAVNPIHLLCSLRIKFFHLRVDPIFKDSVTQGSKHGPGVQSIISLMKSLVKDLLSLLVHIKSSVLIFFAEKVRGAFALQKLLTLFQKKNSVLCAIRTKI